MAVFKSIFFITAAVATLSIIQPITCYSAEENVLYTTVVTKSLLEDMLPVVNPDITIINNTLMRTLIRNILQLHEIKAKINASISSGPSPYSKHLQGLKLMIQEVEMAACKWMNSTIKGGFKCEPDIASSFDSLKTKLDLYEQLIETETIVKEKVDKIKNCTQ